MDVKTVIVEYLNFLSQAGANPDVQLQMIGRRLSIFSVFNDVLIRENNITDSFSFTISLLANYFLHLLHTCL